MTIEELIQTATSDLIFTDRYDANYIIKNEAFQNMLNGYMSSAYATLNLLNRFNNHALVANKCAGIYEANRFKYTLLARTVDLTTIENYFRTLDTTETLSGTGSATTTEAGTVGVTGEFNKGEQNNSSSVNFNKGAATNSANSSFNKGASENSVNTEYTKGLENDSTSVTFTKGEATNSANGELNVGNNTLTDTMGLVERIHDYGATNTTTTNGGSKTSTKGIQGDNSTVFRDSDKTTDTDNTTVNVKSDARQEKETEPETINKHVTDARTDTSTNTTTEGARIDTTATTNTAGEREDVTATTSTEGARIDTTTSSNTEGARNDTTATTSTEGARTDSNTSNTTTSKTTTNTHNDGHTRNMVGFNVMYAALINDARAAAVFNLVSVVAHDIVKVICNLVYNEED